MLIFTANQRIVNSHEKLMTDLIILMNFRNTSDMDMRNEVLLLPSSSMQPMDRLSHIMGFP